MMNFVDALTNMINGKKLMRQIWSGSYIAIYSGQSYIWQIGSTNKNPEPNAITYIPSIDDLLATDWMVKLN